MAKVSIIIPVYNVEKYLRQCLDSCVNQTLRDIEIICVDDCSPDNCPGILDEYSAKDERIKVIHLKENGGQGKAKNIALDNAVGEYLVFLDSDDWLEENALEILYDKISETNDDIIFFGRYLYYEDNKNKREDMDYLLPFKNLNVSSNIDLEQIKQPIIRTAETTSKMYKRDFIEHFCIRYGKNRAGEDWLFSILAIANAKTIAVINLPFYNYRIHNASTIHQADLYLLFFDSLYSTYQLLQQKKYNQNVLNQIYIRYISAILYWYKKWSNINSNIKKGYYTKMREAFIILNNNNAKNVMMIKKYINYLEFKKVIKYSYEQRVCLEFLQKIFSVINNKTHKIITIFGVKIKISRGCKLRNGVENRGGVTLKARHAWVLGVRYCNFQIERIQNFSFVSVLCCKIFNMIERNLIYEFC